MRRLTRIKILVWSGGFLALAGLVVAYVLAFPGPRADWPAILVLLLATQAWRMLAPRIVDRLA